MEMLATDENSSYVGEFGIGMNPKINKFTKDLVDEIQFQEKTIFEIITMASILEKEVQTFEDKKKLLS